MEYKTAFIGALPFLLFTPYVPLEGSIMAVTVGLVLFIVARRIENGAED